MEEERGSEKGAKGRGHAYAKVGGSSDLEQGEQDQLFETPRAPTPSALCLYLLPASHWPHSLTSSLPNPTS